VFDFVRATGAEVIGDHRLRLVFEDGVEGEFDMSGWEWTGVFAPLADPEYFAKVELDELGGLEWPNGASVAPETLRMEAVPS
jgi:hypothetical protein